MKSNRIMMIHEVNKNRQEVIEKTKKKSPSHPFASVWILLYHDCNKSYLANSCDAHIRRCPNCQEGKARTSHM